MLEKECKLLVDILTGIQAVIVLDMQADTQSGIMAGVVLDTQAGVESTLEHVAQEDHLLGLEYFDL